MRVLIADDSSTMRTILRRALEGLGVGGVIEAADGLQAIELFKASHGFDLIVTDWNRPGKTGIELVHEIRAIDTHVPIVMITTESEKTRVVEAIQAGVSDYLIKPFATERLLATLKRFISGYVHSALDQRDGMPTICGSSAR
jgi:two-component system, chemotaxis family, chemotaxis protein CheY